MMENVLKNKNILFFTRAMDLGGTENVILMLCEILRPLVNKIIVCSTGGINVENLISLGIKHYKILDIEKKNLKTLVCVSKSIKTIIKNEKINIIHVHHRMAAFYVSFLRLYKNVSFFATCHNSFFDKRFLTRFAYKHCCLIACGKSVKDNLLDFYGIEPERVTTINNSIKQRDEDFESIRRLQEYKDSGFFLVGTVCRLSKQTK